MKEKDNTPITKYLVHSDGRIDILRGIKPTPKERLLCKIYENREEAYAKAEQILNKRKV